MEERKGNLDCSMNTGPRRTGASWGTVTWIKEMGNLRSLKPEFLPETRQWKAEWTVGPKKGAEWRGNFTLGSTGAVRTGRCQVTTSCEGTGQAREDVQGRVEGETQASSQLPWWRSELSRRVLHFPPGHNLDL